MLLVRTARPMLKILLVLASTAGLVLGTAKASWAQTEPVPADIMLAGPELAEIPEEVLRTEIITAARSPLTGEPLNAAEYAQLLEELEAPAGDSLVNEQIRYLVFLLQLRRSVRPILPFL
ncbi:MAG: hypothetical protein WBB01_15730 [Phormidesmis sp.]